MLHASGWTVNHSHVLRGFLAMWPAQLALQVLYDDRQNSNTKGVIQEVYLTQENYSLLIVPPLIWNGFKGIGTQEVILANCATIPHSAEEIERLPYNDPYIPYDWEVDHR